MTVKNVLVVGGGITGTVAAVALAQKGVKVTLAEIAPQWYGVGHGITLQGNALRSFKNIGALDRILEKAHGFDDFSMYHASGQLLQGMKVAKTGGEDLFGTMGALRSDVQTVLVDMIHELGVEVRLGTSLESYENMADQVEVTFNNGSKEKFDLVIAADGIKSKTREMVGITHDKKSSGLGIWRVVTKRTPEMDCSAVFMGGPEYKAGYTPISKDLCYAYVLTNPVRPDNGLSDFEEMKRLMEGYHGPFDFIRENIHEGDYFSFQEIEWLFVDDEPWHDGRVIVIGDAVHACPPTIAQGGAQCSEDAWVIADMVTQPGEIEDILKAYTARRLPRLKVVVESTLQLVDWELHPDTEGANPGMLMGKSLAQIAAMPV
jgi:2-polyprenyl-6-methoxyphenol hydroxylase-like FAD-dependent oxidoreductase